MNNHYETKTLVAEDVNEAYFRGLKMIMIAGELKSTRNGEAYVHPGTLVTHYKNPSHRMLFAPGRDANPFFHVLEAIWMLSGSNKVAFPAYYVPSMMNFSDDGVTFNGAYGYRWRHAFGVDQLDSIVRALKENPSSRRVVLQMWDSKLDLIKGMEGSKDVCCNLLVKYHIHQGKLNASVLCRSNDMVLGGYGANAVHFSFLQEYLVDCLRLNGVEVSMGWYEQVSMDAHIYEGLYPPKLWAGVKSDLSQVALEFDNPYKELFTISPVLFQNQSGHRLAQIPLVKPIMVFDLECQEIVATEGDASKLDFHSLKSPYLKYVAVPLMVAYNMFRKKEVKEALAFIKEAHKLLQDLNGTSARFDVFDSCEQWLERRI